MKKKVIWLTLLFLGLDILSKLLVDRLPLNNSISIIPSFFYLTKVYNFGASFSILSGNQVLLIIISLIVLFYLIKYINRFKDNIRNTLAFSLLFGGILGNLLNRIIYGYVIDFIDFKIFSWDYPIFNIADIEIFLGVILIAIAIAKKEDNNEVSSK